MWNFNLAYCSSAPCKQELFVECPFMHKHFHGLARYSISLKTEKFAIYVL